MRVAARSTSPVFEPKPLARESCSSRMNANSESLLRAYMGGWVELVTDWGTV